MLKTLFFLAAGIAAACLVSAARDVLMPALRDRFAEQKMLVAQSADMCGMELSQFKCALMAPFGVAARYIFRVMNDARLARIDAMLPDTLALLGNALKTGLSLQQAIEIASLELSPPLGPELVRVSAQLKLGRTVEEALDIFGRRVPTEDAALVIQSITALRRTGGNLIETFATLSATVEGRRRVEERIRVLTANGMYQGLMLLIMPWALGLALYLVAPEYVSPLFDTGLGNIFLGLGVMLEAVGAFWLKKMVIIRV